MDPALPGLCIAQPALAEPFLLEGARVRFVGRQTSSGGEALLCDKHGQASFTVRLQARDLGRAANLALYPGVVRRDLVGSGGPTSEVLVASKTLPLLVWQLSGPATLASHVHIELSTSTVLPEVDHTENSVIVRTQGEQAHFRIEPAPTEIQIQDTGGSVTLHIQLADFDTHSLVLAFGTPAESGAAMDAALHLRGHALRAAEGADDVLQVKSGIKAVDEGVAWALARTYGMVSKHSSAALDLGLAATVLGHRNVATRALSHLQATNLFAASLLAARVTSATGDVQAAADLAERLVNEVGTIDSGLLPLAASSLADALQYGASPAMLNSLREMSLVTPDALPQAPKGLPGTRLPMAGTAATQLGSTTGDVPHTSWLKSLLAGNPEQPPPTLDVRVSRARSAAARFSLDPDSAWADWRVLLDEGLASGPSGPATWDELLPTPQNQVQDYAATLTSELLLAFAHGLLGLVPDAPVGRLRIAPRMPAHLMSFEVEGVSIGDGQMSVIYERERDEISFTLKPERMGVPPLIIFEPSISGIVRKVLMDGKPAELDLKRTGRQTVVPVQLPLDSTRTVTIITE